MLCGLGWHYHSFNNKDYSREWTPKWVFQDTKQSEVFMVIVQGALTVYQQTPGAH